MHLPLPIFSAHPCPLQRRQKIIVTPQAIAEDNILSWSCERFYRRSHETTENSRTWNEGSCCTEEKSGYRVGHVRPHGARHGRGVRLQGGARGQAEGLAGEVAGG